MAETPKWNWQKYNELIKSGPPNPILRRVKVLEDLLQELMDSGTLDYVPSEDLMEKVMEAIEGRIT